MSRFLSAVVLLFLSSTPLVAQDQPPLARGFEFLLAKMNADQGNFEEALRLIDGVIEKDSRNPVLLYERASIQLEAGQVDRAESELRRLLVLAPTFYDAHKVLGRLLLDRSREDKPRLEEALSHLKKALELAPDDLATGVAVAQILASTERAAEAEKIMSGLLERAPDQRTLNFNYGQILSKLGRAADSRRYIERALELDPSFVPAAYQLVELYEREGEWARAAAVLGPLIEQDSLNLDLQRQQGYFYLRAGEPRKARDRFKALLSADPRDERSLFLLAEALGALDEHVEADALYRRLLEKAPNDPELLVSFGLSQIGQSNYDDAARTFETLLTIPKLPENIAVLARTQLAMIDHQKRDYDAAFTRARDLMVLRDKPNMQAINIAVDVLRRQKKFKEAMELLQPLVRQFPADPTIQARFVEFLVRSGDKEQARAVAAIQTRKGRKAAGAVAEAYVQAASFPEAIAVLESSSKSYPEDTDVLFQLGSTFERAGRIADAEKIFLALLARLPDHNPTLNYLGYMWADKGMNLDRATQMLLKAVASEPRNAAFIDSLGWAYFRLGKLELAEQHLKDAARLLPNDPTVQEHLGDLFASQRNYRRALETYANALRLEPEDAAKLRSKIAETEKLEARQ
ncbi:MAG TPA: tetratricopeptide repeat protein [Thermoanaerobaculia bacterium]|nr:tetratricopeptide repeat protein [Thermoanaerobaculia bacterium]